MFVFEEYGAFNGVYMAPDKALFATKKCSYFFLFLYENICCGYSLELPHRGASNEYHNICFCGEIRKIIHVMWIPPLIWN